MRFTCSVCVLQLLQTINEDNMSPLIDVIKQAAVSQDVTFRTLAIYLAPSLCPFLEETALSTYCADWAFSQGKPISSFLLTLHCTY